MSTNPDEIKDIALSLFSKKTFYYDSELPFLWKDELAEVLFLPCVDGEVEVAVSAVLFNFDTPAREVGLASIRDYASLNLNSNSDSGVLPKLFYQVLGLLAEGQIRLLQGESLVGFLGSKEEDWVRKALDENWLDMESRRALVSFLA